MDADEVFKSTRHIRFGAHGVNNSLGALLANIELRHGGSTMSQDAVVVCRSISKESIGSHILIPTVDIVGGEAGAKVFSEWETNGGTGELSGVLDGCFDAVEGYPAKEGAKEFQIRFSDGDVTLLNDKLTSTFIKNEFDVVLEIPSILPSRSSTRIEMEGGMIVGSVQGKVGTGELVVESGRIPDGVGSEYNMW
jgi:hypothetical protein